MDNLETLKTFMDSLNLDFDNKIITINNLDTLEIYLKYYAVSKKTVKYQLKPLLQGINEENYKKTCKVIKLALEVCPDKECFNVLLSKLQNINTIIDLNLLKILLEDRFASQIEGTKYLENLLAIANDKDKEFYNYFISQILPNCIKFGHHEVIWKAVESSKNLDLLCPIISEFLTNDLMILENFWILLQEEFKTKTKTAMYIFKACVEKLKLNLNFTSENCIIDFNTDNKSSWFRAVDYLTILLDVAREKQLHLVQPSLLMLEKITILHKSWLKLIYYILLNHPNNSIVYHSIIIQMRSYVLDDFKDLLMALNKSEYSNLTKETFKNLGVYIMKLNDVQYEKLLEQSLEIRWVPVAFWCFYNSVFVREKSVKLKILEEIVRRAKILPNTYIRKGALDLIFQKIKYGITEKNINLFDLIDILVEFLMDESSKYYGIHILDTFNLEVDDTVLNEMEKWLKEDNPNINKLTLLVEIVTRLNASNKWINDIITKPFLERKYDLVILDRLTYIFCITGKQLETYLLYRLDIPNPAIKICHLDNSRSLANKCVNILTTDHPCHSLALEILYYLNECRFKHVYNFWIGKVLKKHERIKSDVALGFVNLLVKIPRNYIKSNSVHLKDILLVYDVFFATQTSEVAVKIFRNLDFVFENISNDNVWFIEKCISQLVEMKASDCFQDAVRYIVRAVALSFEVVDEKVLDFTLKKIYELAKQSETVAYYSIMYFKCLKISDEAFPKYEFLMHGDVLSKDKIAEYEIFSKIYTYNPFFKAAEIRKWAVEDIILNSNTERIVRVSKYLIEKYKTNFNKRYFPNSQLHMHKLRIMQSLCFLLPLMTLETREELTTLLINSFCIESHQPSIRQLMQYLLIQLLRNNSNIIQETINNASKTTTSTITGFIPILYGLVLLKKEIEFSINVVEILLPWTMGAHFKLRLFSQLVIQKICGRNATNRKFKLKYNGLSKSIQSVLSATSQMDSGILNDINFIEHLILEESSSSKLIHLISIYIPETTGVAPSEWEYFKMKYSYAQYINEKSDVSTEKLDFEEFENIQKKIIPWREFLSPEKSDFILVTTLIDSLANLGGLSRTCEIFGVKQMIVNNKKIVSDKEFQSLSMSSEKWLDIIEVKVADLQEFLLGAKAIGYTVIGAEQASDSVSLEKYIFKEKIILLLGNERSGIPPNLIPLLDVCIEIPQFGVVRSLNVHVAGAMFIWEYTRQRISQ